MEVVEDFESRPHKAVSRVVKREKEILEWNEQKLPKVLPGYRGGRLLGRSAKESGKEEGKDKEENGERRIRNEIAQKVIEGNCARRCRVDHTENSRAKCQAKLELFANRKRRRGGRGRLAKGGPDGSAMG